MAESIRLLVALKPEERLAKLLASEVPGVPWAYASGGAPDAWGRVEAILVDSFGRGLGAFDPATTPRLALLQLLHTGVDGFPFARIPAHVQVAANIGAYAPFVAEHAVALALAAGRSIVGVQAQVHAKTLRPLPTVRLLYGGTAVILGYGAIGREIAQRVAPFGMRVIGVNRSGRMAPGCSAMFPAARLREAVADATVVFDARPLTRASERSIGRDELAAMRPEAVYVNVGRAATVDEEALYHHLLEHPDFRAALDPWWQEDFEQRTFQTRYPLLDLPNFLGTPHMAAAGPASAEYAQRSALDNLARYFRGEPPLYVVDRREYLGTAPESA